MAELVVVPEPLSKNVFEEYFRLIEHLKNNLSDDIEDELKQKAINSFDYLDRVVQSIERTLQDFTSNDRLKTNNKNEIHNAIIEILNSCILPLASWDKFQNDFALKGQYKIIDSFTYYFIPIISVLTHYDEQLHINHFRHLKKLALDTDHSNFSFWKMKFDAESQGAVKLIVPRFSSKIALLRNNWGRVVFRENKEGINEPTGNPMEINEPTGNQMEIDEPTGNPMKIDIPIEKSQINMLEALRSTLHQFSPLPEAKVDPTSISEMEKRFYSEYITPLFTKYNDNLFKINEFDDFEKIKEVDTLRKRISEIDYYEPLERLFFFDDTKENAIWDIVIKIEATTYNASEIGFLIWSFSKALETIDDVEVELVRWGEGSKWIRFKLRIKSLASKVDVHQVFKEFAQAVEVAHTKKPLEEIQKFEAEKDKIKKETENTMSKDQSDKLHELSIKERELEIQKRMIDLEEKKVDVSLKKLQLITGITNLMASGVIQNNSNIQITINDTLLLKKENQKIEIGNVDLMDIKEKIELKADNPDNQNKSNTAE